MGFWADADHHKTNQHQSQVEQEENQRVHPGDISFVWIAFSQQLWHPSSKRSRRTQTASPLAQHRAPGTTGSTQSYRRHGSPRGLDLVLGSVNNQLPRAGTSRACPQTHSSILAWRILWTEETGGLQSTGSKRVRQDWSTNTPTNCLWLNQSLKPGQ